jgi:2-methylaconitate cis-trans-isomerase PrpF
MIAGIPVTIIDVAVPLVIVPAEAVGKTGHETKAELDADPDLIALLQKIRNEAGLRMGLGDTSALVVPKPILVSAPTTGVVTSRDFVPYACHATHSVTGAIALATAAVLPGTVAADVVRLPGGTTQNIVIEHPSGVIEVEVEATGSDPGSFELAQATLVRTCRKLFDGVVCLPADMHVVNA